MNTSASFASVNPCGLRPAYGIGCARNYGKDCAFAKKEKPSPESILEHVQGDKFSKVHRSNLVRAAEEAYETAARIIREKEETEREEQFKQEDQELEKTLQEMCKVANQVAEQEWNDLVNTDIALLISEATGCKNDAILLALAAKLDYSDSYNSASLPDHESFAKTHNDAFQRACAAKRREYRASQVARGRVF